MARPAFLVARKRRRSWRRRFLLFLSLFMLAASVDWVRNTSGIINRMYRGTSGSFKNPFIGKIDIFPLNRFWNNSVGFRQLTRIERQFQKSTIAVSPISTKSDSDKKLKEPIFKPFQVSKTSQKLVQESKSDFAKAIRDQLDRIEASSSSSKVQIVLNLARLVYWNMTMSIASSDIKAFIDEPSAPKANKIHWELALPTVKTPSDLAIDNRPSLLQQMTMAANAYKTQAGTSDRAITEILVAGFTGQLKGWWDHLLTQQQQLDVLNSIQVDENGAPILDEFNSPIQDAVVTLILTISFYFIGDPSHLRDKNAELLHNLRCRKLSEFQSYKTTFFTRLFLRDNANHITWKKKFLAGLPTLLGEKVRNSIKALYDNWIPYDELTYGELVSFVNKEGLKICQDLKLQKRLKWEFRKSKQELKLHELGLDEEILFKVAPLLVESSDSESFMTGDSEPLQVDELNDSESVSSSDSDTSNSDSYLKKINVLTKDQEIFLELVKHISDPNLQKEYLDKLLKTLDSNKAETSKVPIIKKNSYDLTEILDVKVQETFLTQKSKAQSLLASAKTKEEYFKVMEQLLTSRSKSSVADSSDDDEQDEEPFISLGDENEDDCFGIFSPIKHCK
ncbi:hypothetical protein KPL70_021933 [Citrus sinensis]|nr:hypothetical protein KPL70_021933 [Citrus sinensis]